MKTNKNGTPITSPESCAGELARDMKEAFRYVSPFIQHHTEIVCPDCENLCCKDRHGRYDSNDLFFFSALGIAVTEEHSGREESGPCRHMGEKGCSLERWRRPFRCTHFFCDALLKSLENDNAKLYRTFVDYLQYLISARERLLKACQPA